jgi:hypothetical protein
MDFSKVRVERIGGSRRIVPTRQLLESALSFPNKPLYGYGAMPFLLTHPDFPSVSAESHRFPSATSLCLIRSIRIQVSGQ